MADLEREDCLRVLEWIDGKDDGVVKINGYPQENTEWFIVSCKWLNKWKRINKVCDDINETDMDEDIGEINSDDIIDSSSNLHILNNYILNPGLVHRRDYEILPKKAWKSLSKKYKFKHKIIRKSIEIERYETQIEISLFPLHIIFAHKGKLISLEPSIYHVSRKDRLSEIVDYAKKFLSQSQPTYKGRLWKLNIDTKIDDLKELIDTSNSKPIIFPGLLLENQYETVDKVNIRFEDIIVLETSINYASFDLFKERDKEKCEGCYKYSYGGRRCECKKYYYCNDMCEEKDRNFHYCRVVVKIFTRTENSCLGRVGLQNIGNTCYMNSGLQCLSNTYALTKYILDDSYINDINTTNVLGSKGLLIREYAALIKEMWYGSSHHITPWGLKNAFSNFAKQFIGYHQQDSQEMLSFLIDGIHEDLNRIKNKPNLADPEPDGLTEQEFADKFWDNHLQRNNSIIVDLMHGQYRSEVECPDCHKLSITFDPFLMLTLPIPDKKIKNIEFIYISDDAITKAKVSVTNPIAREFKIKACEYFNLNPQDIIIADTSMGSIKNLINDNSVKLSKRSTILLYNKTKLDEGENEDDYFEIFCDFRKKSYGYVGSIIGQPKILKIPKSLTLKDLYHHIFAYIMRLRKEEVDDIEQHFREKFVNFFSKSYSDNFFSLKIHNPYQYPCCVCDRISCPGCPLSYENKDLSKYINNCKEPNARISINFEQAVDTNFLTEVTIHESYYTNHENNIQESIPISECFNLFSKKEQLDEQNTTYCSKCKTHNQVIKKMDIYRLPKILVIHFKRFKQKGYFSSKNNKLIDFPLEGLDMKEFSLGCEGIYDLYAVSNHYGSLEGGHYTAYAKSQDGEWRDFDDSSVSIVNNVKDQVVASSAYVLLYQKRDNSENLD